MTEPNESVPRDRQVVELLLTHPPLLTYLPELYRRDLASVEALSALTGARMPGGAPVLDFLKMLPEPPVSLEDALLALRMGPALVAADPQWARQAYVHAVAFVEAMPPLGAPASGADRSGSQTGLHYLLQRAHAEHPEMTPTELLGYTRRSAEAGARHAYQVLLGIKDEDPLDIIAMNEGPHDARRMVQTDPQLGREGAYRLLRAGVKPFQHTYFVRAGVHDPERIIELMKAGITHKHAEWAADSQADDEPLVPDTEWEQLFAGFDPAWLNRGIRRPLTAREVRALLDEKVDREVLNGWLGTGNSAAPRWFAGEHSADMVRAGISSGFVNQLGILIRNKERSPEQAKAIADAALELWQAGVQDPEFVRTTVIGLDQARKLNLQPYHLIALHRANLTRGEWDQMPDSSYLEADDVLNQLALLRSGMVSTLTNAIDGLRDVMNRLYEKRVVKGGFYAEKQDLHYFGAQGGTHYLRHPSYRRLLWLRDMLREHTTVADRKKAQPVIDAIDAMMAKVAAAVPQLMAPAVAV